MLQAKISHLSSALKSKLTPYQTNKIDYKQSLLKLFIYSSFGCFFISIALLSHYYLTVSNEQKYALHKEKITVELIEQTLTENLTNMAADAKNFAFISRTLMALPTADRTLLLNQYFLQFSQNQSDYSQIRLLDNSGQELVRINHVGKQYEIVKEAQLQDKSRRYYFQESRKLAPNQVYISPLDHNMEDGKLEQPAMPTIRVSAPIYDQDQLVGVIVLNYRALPLIKQLLRLSPYFLNRLYIINNEAAALIQPINNPLDTRESVSLNPNILNFIDINGAKHEFIFNTSNAIPLPIQNLLKTQASGRLVNTDAYLTFATSLAPDNKRWHIVSSFSKLYFARIRAQFFHQYLVFYLLLYSLVILVCAYVIFNQARHQAQKKQRAYEQQFRQVLEQIQLLAVSLNQKGKVVFCNDFFLKRAGYKKNEVIGQDWVSLFIPIELREQVQTALQQALKQGRHQASFKDVIQDKTGQIHLVSWTSTLQRRQTLQASAREQEQLGVLTLVGEDITQQEQTQAQLVQLNHAVEQSQNSVIVTDLEGKIIYVNPTFCEITGYQKSEVLGSNPKFLQSGEIESPAYETLWQALLAGKEWRGELHNKKKDGSLFWERAIISPVKDAKGNNLYYVGVKQDISQEKQLAQALEDETRQRLQHEKLATIGKVVSMIAHDLRNPLSSIKMVLQMYQRKNQDELCQISLQQVRYMEAILEDLLTYSKPEKHQPLWLDFNKFVNQIVMTQERLAREQNVLIEMDLEAKLPTLFADPIKLKQALQNVLVNAIQACTSTATTHQAKVKIKSRLVLNRPVFRSKGNPNKLALTCAEDTSVETKNRNGSPYLLIDIFNTGIPIDENLVEQVFEPFFTTKASGTGLGLAIVKRIIELHQGLIQVNPVQHKGTQICIALPASTADQTQTIHPILKQDKHEQITNM